jgi:hypothetical protein
MRQVLTVMLLGLVAIGFAVPGNGQPTTVLPGQTLPAVAPAPSVAKPRPSPVPSGPTTSWPPLIYNDQVFDRQGNLIAEGTVDAVNPDSLYWRAYNGTNLMMSGKLTSPTPQSRTTMAFQSDQDVVCMTPDGNYVYDVYQTTMRRFSTSDGSYTPYTLSYSSNGACGTDGNFVFVFYSTTVYKYTLTGTYVNATTIDQITTQYACAVANDTVWVGDWSGVTYYGYACSRFNGGSISYDKTWAVGGGTGGAAMNIAWDGTYYYWVMGGYGSNSFKRFYRDRTLYTNGMATIDARAVMCKGPTAGPVSPDSLYFKDYNVNYLRAAPKVTNPTPANRTGMTWQDVQTVPCMDPAGQYVYEVLGTTMRQYNTATGAITTTTLSYSGNGACGTNGSYLFGLFVGLCG